MTRLYEFPCGCSWPILEDNPPDGVVPLLDFDIEKAPEDCPGTWAMLGKGLTKGVFQLESSLGKTWTKKLKPENLEHMTALGAILRPGTLTAVDENDVSATAHYCRRKNNEEETKSYHPAIDAILFPTYNIIAYQEQSMAIAQAVAAFDLQQADILRKSIGKKDTAEMAKCEKIFLDGAKKAAIISEDMAKEVFGWIKKSQRYAFNRCVAGNEKFLRPDGAVSDPIGIMAGTSDYGYGLSRDKYGFLHKNRIESIKFVGRRTLYRIELRDGRNIRVTGNHKFPTSHGERTAVQMRRLMKKEIVYLFIYDGNKTRKMAISAIVRNNYESTYDVTMSAPHHNFVTGAGIVTCNSHSCAYGLTGYDSAYIKAHFPLAFFTSWLYNARHKQDPKQERFELINEARLFDIVVEPPDLRSLEPHFHTDRKVVKFGLTDIKGVGLTQIDKLRTIVAELGRPLESLTWFEFLIFISDKLKSSVVTRFIEVGALRWMNVPRQVMLAELRVWNDMTDKERQWVRERGTSDLKTALKAATTTKKEGGACANKNRVAILQSLLSLLEKPPTSLVDSPHWIAYVEEELLGISLSCSKIDSCDISQVNVTCREYLAGRTGFLMFGVEVQGVREVKTKKGKNPGQKMAFLTIGDGSCSLDDVVCFPDVWAEYSHLLVEGNTVILQGSRDNKKDVNTLTVQKVWQANQAAGCAGSEIGM